MLTFIHAGKALKRGFKGGGSLQVTDYILILNLKLLSRMSLSFPVVLFGDTEWLV